LTLVSEFKLDYALNIIFFNVFIDEIHNINDSSKLKPEKVKKNFNVISSGNQINLCSNMIFSIYLWMNFETLACSLNLN